jgi:hypothetical protein
MSRTSVARGSHASPKKTGNINLKQISNKKFQFAVNHADG